MMHNKRAQVFVDSNNIFYAFKKRGLLVEYGRLERFIYHHLNRLFPTSVEVLHPMLFYSAAPASISISQQAFFEFLRLSGFEVRTRTIKEIYGKQKGNIDIMLSVDAIKLKDNFEIFILIGGDGDYAYLIENLINNYRKEVVVFTEPISLSSEIKSIPYVHIIDMHSEENLPLIAKEERAS